MIFESLTFPSSQHTVMALCSSLRRISCIVFLCILYAGDVATISGLVTRTSNICQPINVFYQNVRSIMALLHYVTCIATCLATFVATQVASEIARCNMPRNHKVRQHFRCKKHCTSRIRFYFSQRSPQRCNLFSSHCTV